MAAKGEDEMILDLSNKNLKKLEPPESKEIHTLIIDKNCLSKLDSLDSFPYLRKLSAEDNDLIRMYGVSKLTNLRILNLADNNIVCIEGLKELMQLQWLNLSSNNLKNIDHLNNCVSLEHLDLSDNNITHLSDISFLKSLKALLLHKNKIPTLRYSSNYFPSSVTLLTISENCISDINEVSYLGGLSCLEQLSITSNPCYNMTGESIGYDYRPFVINWCLHLRVLDGYVVSPKESLKAEWLYSQGKGRHFRPGEHSQTVAYLAQVCPMTAAEELQTEEDVKLSRILNKQKQHQLQLLEELSKSQPGSPIPMRSSASRSDQSPSPSLRRKPLRKISPKPFCASDRDSKRTSPLRSHSSSSYPVELPASLYVFDIDAAQTVSQTESSLTEQPMRPQTLFNKTSKCMSSEDSARSVYDVERQSTAAAGLPTETHYVPVPETMLSPDFRPIAMSPPHVYGALNGETSRLASSIPVKDSLRSKNLPSSIRQSSRSPSHQTLLDKLEPSKGSMNSHSHLPIESRISPLRQQERKPTNHQQPRYLTDSPLLRRTAALHKLTKHKLLSLNSPRKRSTSLRLGLDSASSADSMSENDSTDSEISLSKLALVKEIAANRKIKKFLKNSPQFEKDNCAEFAEKLKQHLQTKQLEKLMFHTKEKKDDEAVPNVAPAVDFSEKTPINGERKVNGQIKIDPLSTDTEKHFQRMTMAAVAIQSRWRGYRTRHLSSAVEKMKSELRQRRNEDHLKILMQQLEQTQQELEQERQLRALQAETIKALWKEVQILQSGHSENTPKQVKDDETSIDSRNLPSGLSKLLTDHPILKTYAKNETHAFLLTQNKDLKLPQRNEISIDTQPGIEDEEIPVALCGSDLKDDISESKDKDVEDIGSGNDEKTENTSELSFPGVENGNNQQTNLIVKQLSQTCNELTSQVQHLQQALQVVYKAVFSSGSITPSYTNQNMVSSMVQSMSSEASGCSCQSSMSLPANLEFSDRNNYCVPGSMVSSMVSVDSNFETGQMTDSMYGLKNNLEDDLQKTDALRSPGCANESGQMSKTEGFTTISFEPCDSGTSNAKYTNDEICSNSRSSRKQGIQIERSFNDGKTWSDDVDNGNCGPINSQKTSKQSASAKTSKMGAYLPGLKENDDQGNSSMTLSIQSPDGREEKRVIKVQVMQARLIEIEEITPVEDGPRVNGNPDTDECTSGSYSNSSETVPTSHQSSKNDNVSPCSTIDCITMNENADAGDVATSSETKLNV